MIFHFYRNPNYLKSLLQFPKIFLLPSQPHFHSRQITCHNCRWPHAIQVHQIHRSVEAVAVMVHRVWTAVCPFMKSSLMKRPAPASYLLSSVRLPPLPMLVVFCRRLWYWQAARCPVLSSAPVPKGIVAIRLL